ncbi:tyrosine-type recombinase/integrase [Thermoactinomyces mirandus]|uniref:Tyrosine-type recombinase/integrase n=1 Tax=Thermoactinomyces mirandus TaxID=2756294 RepID=A0A7W1XR78_9BACL|nr:tyrosine-type recombinase/integrase [Thermoactinomyces mirandus]MBA4601797.1 tyrosine-type recombinase/integrase [Thermoactinomyces mirandus]
MDVGTFSDFIDEFVKWLIVSGKRERTIDEYVTAVMLFAVWLGKNYHPLNSPAQVLGKHILAWQNELLTGKKLSIATVHKRMASLKSFWNFLVEKNLVRQNPLEDIQLRQTVSPPLSHSWLSRQEEVRLLTQIEMEKNDWKQARNRCMVLLMLDAGCTVSELVQIDWDQILWEKHEILIKNELFERRVPVTGRLYRALQDWYRQTDRKKGPAICSQWGKRMTRQGVHYLVKKYMNDTGMKQYSAHTLRHTFCRRLIEAKVDLETVTCLAGHQSIETTKRYL